MASYETNGTTSKDYNDLHPSDTREDALHKIRTAGSVTMPPELFEKLYLTPQDVAVKGGLRKTLGNPTPLGLGGFLLSLSPLCCDLMNWRGAGPQNGASDIGAYFFFGGLLMTIASIFELILGNTYISVVFGMFGAFWLTFGAVEQPFYSSYGNYSPDPTKPWLGIEQPAFNSAFGFFLFFMGVLCTIYLIGAFRTNLVLVLILFPLPFAFGLLAATFWYLSEGGHMALANTLKVTAGGFLFVTCMAGWYLFAALIFAALDMPFQLPVFDLSARIKGASQRSQSVDA